METVGFIILSTLFVLSAHAQTIKQRMAASSLPITMSCVRSSAGGSNRITWQTDYGSQARDISRSLTYTCNLKWSGKQATNAVIDVWFVGVPGDGGEGKEIILDNNRIEVSLSPGMSWSTNVTSVIVENNKTNYAAIGIKETSGSKLRGCVIQLLMDGNVVRCYSSEGHLQKAAWLTPFGSVDSGVIGEK